MASELSTRIESALTAAFTTEAAIMSAGGGNPSATYAALATAVGDPTYALIIPRIVILEAQVATLIAQVLVLEGKLAAMGG